MKLKAITHCYTEEGVTHQRVVGILKPSCLKDAFKIIKSTYTSQGLKIKKDVYDESCDNYFLSFKSNNNDCYYSGDYNLNQMYL